MNKFFSLVLVALLFSACDPEPKQHPMVGLWQISTVTIDGEEYYITAQNSILSIVE